MIDERRYATAPVAVRIKRARGHMGALIAELKFSLSPEAMRSALVSIDNVLILLNSFDTNDGVMVAD